MKSNILSSLANISGNSAAESFGVCLVNCFGNVSKVLAQFKNVFNFKKFLNCLLLNVLIKADMCHLLFIFLNREFDLECLQW